MPMQIEEESGCENDNFVDGILQDELKIVVFTQTILLQEQLVLRLKCLFVLTLFYSILCCFDTNYSITATVGIRTEMFVLLQVPLMHRYRLMKNYVKTGA